MDNWPATLPQDPRGEDGFTIVPAPNVIASQMAVGPPKVRRRATASYKTVAFRLMLSPTDTETHDTFFTTTLADGTLPFTWTDFITSAACNYKYDPATPPKYSDAGAGYFYVDIQLLRLP